MHAHQMSEAQILAEIETNPRFAHIAEAIHRDPATIDRNPAVDPMHIDQARKRHAERLATVKPVAMFPGLFATLAATRETDH